MVKFISKQIFLLFLTIIYAASSVAQITVSATCSSVVVTNSPNFATNLYALASTSGSGCTRFASDPNKTMKASYTLQSKGTTGAWTTVSTLLATGNPTFGSLGTGTFRVLVRVPIKVASCTNGIQVVNSLGQNIGFVGDISASPTSTSNEIFVGATQPNDIQFTFVDNNSNSNNLAWDANEAKVINTSGTKAGTYDRYWLAIIEQSSPNRFKSQGWTFAQMPTTIDIEQIWKQSFPGGFNSLGSYYVQLAAMNGCNTSGWVEANNSQGSRTFFVCPPGSGCREMGKEETIVISPNPTSSSFRLMGMDETSDYSLTLTDISGRTLKTYVNVSNQDLDVADLPTGMYLAQLWNGAKKVQTSKLSIVK